MTPTRALLANGRQHFQHGPIDLVIGAQGRQEAVEAAHAAAWSRFESVLQELVNELPLLKKPVADSHSLHGAVARRMWRACKPFDSEFITPMAAVAGSVAEEIIKAYMRDGVNRAWVNNGGDIALHLIPGSSANVGLFADLGRFHPGQSPRGLPLDGQIRIDAASPVRGIATSGWRGRSFSLGIADSVTVLARTASQADAAATIIANAVNVDVPGIKRRAAAQMRHDSDLGDIQVTVDVPELPAPSVREALHHGLLRAHEVAERGLIESCALVCQGQFAQVGFSDREPSTTFMQSPLNVLPA